MGRAWRKDIALTIGPITTLVNLHTVVPGDSKGSQVKRICPDHKVPLKQSLACPEDNQRFSWGEWMEAVETPQGWRQVDPSERPTLEEGTKSLELVPVPVKEIEDNSFEGDSCYWLEPSNEVSLTTWSILVQQLKTGKVVFLTRGGFSKGHKEKLWKIELFRGYPILRELLFPDVIKEPPEAEPVKVDKETRDLVKQFIETRMSTWEDIDTTDNLQKQFEKWIQSGELVTVTESTGSAPKQTHEDMIANLKEAVSKTKQ